MRATVVAILAVCSLVLAVQGAPRHDEIPGVLEDVRMLVRDSNEERIDVLERLLKARGFPVTRQSFENPHPGARRPIGTNLVVTLGDGPRDLVVGAHVDAAVTPDGIVDGALDNGAGVVAVSRLAGSLRDHTLRHRLLVVFFDMEESGLLGSAHFASTADRSRIDAVVNVDIVGAGDTVLLGPDANPGNEAVYAVAAETCAGEAFTCLRFGHYPPSDDLSFQAAGVPNVSVGIMPRLEADQLWLRLNGGDRTGPGGAQMSRLTALIHTSGDRVEEVQPRAVQLAHDFLERLVVMLDARFR